MMDRGAFTKRRLLTTQRVKDRKTGKVKPEVKNTVVRKWPACPTPGCGRKAFIKVHTEASQGAGNYGSADSAVRCLMCGHMRAQ